MGRPKNPTITDLICAQPVKERTKITCNLMPGFYVSITSRGEVTFNIKFDGTSKEIARYRQEQFSAETQIVAAVRATVPTVRSDLRTGVVAAPAMVEAGLTFKELVARYIAYSKGSEAGSVRPRLKTWEQSQSYLNRAGREAQFNTRIAASITTLEIKAYLRAIESAASSNRMRDKLTAFFKFACAKDYLTATPCINLEEKRKERGRKTYVPSIRIKALWDGLSDPLCPGPLQARLALKMVLCTALRTIEVVLMQRSWFNLDPKNPTVTIPVAVMKMSDEDCDEDTVQPLNPLAVAVVREAMRLTNGDFLFSKDGSKPYERSYLSRVVLGEEAAYLDGVLPFLGWGDDPKLKWTPYSLRRTAATLLGDLGHYDAFIGLLLNHAPTGVTANYNRSQRLRAKRILCTDLNTMLMSLIEPDAGHVLPDVPLPMMNRPLAA